MDVLNDTIVECRWEINIEGCKDVSFFRTIKEIASTLHIILFILNTSLLLYRKVKWNSILWNGQCFTAIDGFLFWADIWCIGRLIFITDQLINFTNDSIILRHILFEIMAFPPIIAVATYTSGLFYAIPRMNFHQHSSTQISHTSTTLTSKLVKIIKNPQSSNQIYLPRPHIVSRIYWIFVGFFFMMTVIPLMVSAIAQQNNNYALKDVFWPFHFLMYAIAFGILTFVLVSYGRMLVHLIEGLVSLSNDELERQKYKKFASKIKIFNLTLTLVFLWYIFGLTIFAFWRRQIYSNEVVNKIFAFVIEIFAAIATLIIICVLFYSEIMASKIVATWTTSYPGINNPIPDYTEDYNNDNNIINETREFNVIDTRTSWYSPAST